jgi:hypothetical protein
MKKLIGTVCALTAFGFAAAIANADDTASTTSQDTSSSMEKSMDTASRSAEEAEKSAGEAQKSAEKARKNVDEASKSMDSQSAGTMGSDSSMSSSESTTKTTESTKWKNAKTCTDAEGVTYHRGKKGFDNCVAQMKRAHKKDEQMGGTTGAESSQGMKQDSGMGSSSSGWSSGSNDYSKPDSMSGDTQHKGSDTTSNPNP